MFNDMGDCQAASKVRMMAKSKTDSSAFLCIHLVKDLMEYIKIEHGEKIKNFDSIKESIKTLAPHLPLLDEPSPCALVLFKEEERKFLENVSEAITKNLIPSKVITLSHENEFSQNRFLKYILYPKTAAAKWSFYQKIKDVPIHTPYEIEGLYHILLADIQTYNENLNLKRSLWNILKNTLRSSPTLPSIKL